MIKSVHALGRWGHSTMLLGRMFHHKSYESHESFCQYVLTSY